MTSWNHGGLIFNRPFLSLSNPLYSDSSLALAHDELGLVDNGSGNVDFLNNAPSTKGDSQYDYLSANIVGTGSLSIGSQNEVPTLKATGDAGYDQVQSATLTNGSDNSHTIITVVKLAILGGGTRRIFSMQTSPARPQMMTLSGVLYFFPGGDVSFDSNKIENEWVVIACRADDVAGDYDMQVYGVESAIDSGVINPIGVSQLFNSGGSNYSTDIEMACKYAFTEYLSDAKIEKYCSFLANKYNTIKPLTDPVSELSLEGYYAGLDSFVADGTGYRALNLGSKGSDWDLDTVVNDDNLTLGSQNGNPTLVGSGSGGLSTSSQQTTLINTFTVLSVFKYGSASDAETLLDTTNIHRYNQSRFPASVGYTCSQGSGNLAISGSDTDWRYHIADMRGDANSNYTINGLGVVVGNVGTERFTLESFMCNPVVDRYLQGEVAELGVGLRTYSDLDKARWSTYSIKEYNL